MKKDSVKFSKGDADTLIAKTAMEFSLSGKDITVATDDTDVLVPSSND